MKLLGWTRNAAPERATYGLALVPLEELFSVSDVVTVHLSYTPQTERLVSRDLLSRLKPSALFINTARAKIVDNQALAELLRQGCIAGAALDVHEEEPLPSNYLFAALPNVLLTRTSGSTRKRQRRRCYKSPTPRSRPSCGERGSTSSIPCEAEPCRIDVRSPLGQDLDLRLSAVPAFRHLGLARFQAAATRALGVPTRLDWVVAE